MRALRRAGVIGVVTASVFALSTAAKADPRETAPPGLSHSLSHVDVSTRGHDPHGVPGAAGNAWRRSTGNGISYHGGPVLYNLNGVNVYLIWYGNWAGNTAKEGTTPILPTLITGLSGSPYYNINTTYYDGSSRHVPNKVNLAGQASDAGSQGISNLSDNAINAIVTNAITTKALPSDPNGLYMVLTAPNVTKSGFLTQYCGWHTNATIGGVDIKYAFIGDPGSTYACSTFTGTASPNNNPGADAMASIMAHELEETATDPDLNAWWDSRGYENADKCAWTFGNTYAVNGTPANMKLGGLNFLIQRNWVNASGGYCAQSY
jgi:hypothetical protein